MPPRRNVVSKTAFPKLKSSETSKVPYFYMFAWFTLLTSSLTTCSLPLPTLRLVKGHASIASLEHITPPGRHRIRDLAHHNIPQLRKKLTFTT